MTTSLTVRIPGELCGAHGQDVGERRAEVVVGRERREGKTNDGAIAGDLSRLAQLLISLTPLLIILSFA